MKGRGLNEWKGGGGGGSNFNREYANKSGQERQGVRRGEERLMRGLNGKASVRSDFQGVDGKPVEKGVGGAPRETMERSAEVAREIVFIISTRPRFRVLIKPARIFLVFFCFFKAKSCLRLLFFSLYLSSYLFKPSIILLLLLASRIVEAVNAGPIEPKAIY